MLTAGVVLLAAATTWLVFRAEDPAPAPPSRVTLPARAPAVRVEVAADPERAFLRRSEPVLNITNTDARPLVGGRVTLLDDSGARSEVHPIAVLLPGAVARVEPRLKWFDLRSGARCEISFDGVAAMVVTLPPAQETVLR